MAADLTLDEMILQYSENPFVDAKKITAPAFSDRKQRHKILTRLMLIASNLFSKNPETEMKCYKKRYWIELG